MKPPVTESGLPSVSRERWAQAQQWESGHWQSTVRGPKGRLRRLVAKSGLGKLGPGLRRMVGEGDDWNHWWAQQFDNFSSVPSKLENALELGCGPFTNIRLIWAGRTIEHVFCSDPLARKYVRLRGCWLAESYRRSEVLIDDHPAEECPFATDYFDLTVMINVLDHVQDPKACVASALRVTKPGGLLLLGQDLTNEVDLRRLAHEDVGHPIRVTHESLDELLLPYVEPQVRKVLDRDQGRNPAAHYGTYILAGRTNS